MQKARDLSRTPAKDQSSLLRGRRCLVGDLIGPVRRCVRCLVDRFLRTGLRLVSHVFGAFLSRIGSLHRAFFCLVGCFYAALLRRVGSLYGPFLGLVSSFDRAFLGLVVSLFGALLGPVRRLLCALRYPVANILGRVLGVSTGVFDILAGGLRQQHRRRASHHQPCCHNERTHTFSEIFQTTLLGPYVSRPCRNSLRR